MKRLAAALCASTLLLAPAVRAQEEPPQVELPPNPPPAPKTKPPTPVPPHTELAPKCEEAYIEHVYKNTKPSVVRITRPDGGLGTGFVFHSNRHIATALHVVDLGRELKVEFPNGKVTTAEVVAYDEQHDVALLELAAATDAPVLQPRQNVNIGAPVLAIGNPYGDLTKYVEDLEGLLNFSVTQGIVSAKSEAYIQTDAVLSPGNSGGPMLTCDGKVVGVADKLLESRIGFGVPIAHVIKLTQKIGDKKYRGRWTSRDGGLGVLLMADDANTYLGFYLGGSLVAYDRIAITTRIGMGFAGKGDTSEPVVDRSIRRLFGEMTVGYRFLLFPFSFPLYATVGGGFLGTFDRGEETKLSLNGATPPAITARTTNIRGGGIEPLVTAVFHLDAIEASYGFALDPIHPKYSTHQVLVGLSF